MRNRKYFHLLSASEALGRVIDPVSGNIGKMQTVWKELRGAQYVILGKVGMILFNLECWA